MRIDRLGPNDRTACRSSRRRHQGRYVCELPACDKTFARPSDLKRHRRTIHSQGHEHYHCITVGCEHQNRRLDKMQEHCRKVHGQQAKDAGFVTINDELAKMAGCMMVVCSDFGEGARRSGEGAGRPSGARQKRRSECSRCQGQF